MRMEGFHDAGGISHRVRPSGQKSVASPSLRLKKPPSGASNSGAASGSPPSRFERLTSLKPRACLGIFTHNSMSLGVNALGAAQSECGQRGDLTRNNRPVADFPCHFPSWPGSSQGLSLGHPRGSACTRPKCLADSAREVYDTALWSDDVDRRDKPGHDAGLQMSRRPLHPWGPAAGRYELAMTVVAELVRHTGHNVQAFDQPARPC